MGINNAENGIGDAFINRLGGLERDFNEFKTRPQQIGNGSINYAYFGEINAGPFTVASGLTTRVTVRFAPIDQAFYYNGQPAINRMTLSQLFWTVKVDVNDSDHIIPYGAALTGPQTLAITSSQYDYYGSGLSDSNGQMYVIMQITNIDTSSHTYWVSARMAIPRPALKPL